MSWREEEANSSSPAAVDYRPPWVGPFLSMATSCLEGNPNLLPQSLRLEIETERQGLSDPIHAFEEIGVVDSTDLVAHDKNKIFEANQGRGGLFQSRPGCVRAPSSSKPSYLVGDRKVGENADSVNLGSEVRRAQVSGSEGLSSIDHILEGGQHTQSACHVPDTNIHNAKSILKGPDLITDVVDSQDATRNPMEFEDGVCREDQNSKEKMPRSSESFHGEGLGMESAHNAR